MFNIGDFATFTQVSVRTLRHWQRVGVLQPAWVNPETGYRRYTADQALVAHRILALQGLGFTLASIATMLAAPLDVEELREAVRAQRRIAEQQRADAERRLVLIDAKLRLLEGVTPMSTYDVVRTTVAPARLAAIAQPLGVTDDDPALLYEVFGGLFARLGTALAERGIAPVGPPWSLYDRSTDAGLVVHAAFPVGPDAAIEHPDAAGSDELVVMDSVATDVVSTVHTGPVHELGGAYQALMQWIEAAQLEPAGGSIEISLVWDAERPERNVTELRIPVTDRVTP